MNIESLQERSWMRMTFIALGASCLMGLVPTSATAAMVPEIPQRAVTSSACPFELAPALAGRAACGHLTVPENRAQPASRSVTVNFVVIAPERPAVGRNPLLFIMGGNGSGLKHLRRQPQLAASLSVEDTVIFVDHRGSAPWGQPQMSCPGYAEGLDAALADAEAVKVEACRRHLAERLDLNAYGPYEAAQDLRDLRIALGIQRWNVYGVSYGTTIGQRLLGIDDAAIGGIVLDGMSGLESNSYAESYLLDPLLDLIDECAASAECNRAFPDFERRLGQVAASLARKPRQLAGRRISNTEYLALIREAMADPERRGRIPAAVARSSRGDHGGWLALQVPHSPGPRGADPAFTWPSSVCRDEYPRREGPDRQQPARRPLPDAIRTGAVMLDGENWDWGNFCSRMGFLPAALETVTVKRSAVPALMLVGQLDQVTPRTWSEQSAANLQDVRTVIFPGTGHFVLLAHPECAGGIMRRFFSDSRKPLDTRCADALPGTAWQVDTPASVRR